METTMVFHASNSSANSENLLRAFAEVCGSNAQFPAPSSGAARFPSRCARQRSLNRNVSRY